MARQRSGARRLERAFIGSASRALGRLVPGGDVAILTSGQFGLSNLVEAVLRQIGPARCDVATWTAAKRAIRHLRRLQACGRLTSVRWWLDPSFQRRHPAYLADVMRGFGAAAVRLAPVHAKIVTLVNDTWAVTIRGSLNLNHAVRAELIEVSDDRALAAWLTEVVDDVFAGVPAGTDGAGRDEASVLARVFGADVAVLPGASPIFGADLTDAGRPGWSRGI